MALYYNPLTQDALGNGSTLIDKASSRRTGTRLESGAMIDLAAMNPQWMVNKVVSKSATIISTAIVVGIVGCCRIH